MTDLVTTYLECMNNFHGRYTHPNKVTELLDLFKWQIDMSYLLDKFPAGSKAGDLLRGLK